MIKVENFVECFEVDGKDTKLIDAPVLIFRSHWVHEDRVVIETPEGKRYTLLIKDVLAAITNSGNNARY